MTVDSVILVFLIIGAVGLVVLLLSVLFGDLLDFGGDGFSVPVVAIFAGVLGFGGAIAAGMVPGPAAMRATAAVGTGALLALPAAWLTYRLTRAAMTMHTDTTPSSGDMLGASGTVVTPITSRRHGEVRVVLAGQPVKVRASCDGELASGTPVFVVHVESETSVVVESQAALLSREQRDQERPLCEK